jgi:hypothetical protein
MLQITVEVTWELYQSSAAEDVAPETNYIFMSQRARTGNVMKFKLVS